MRKIILLIIILYCMGFAQTINISDYMPIEVGNKWVYVSNFDPHSPDTLSKEYVDTFYDDTIKTYIRIDIGFWGTDTTFSSIRSDGMYSYETWLYVPRIGLRKQAMHFLAPTTFVVGDTWKVCEDETTYYDGPVKWFDRVEKYVVNTFIVDTVITEVDTFLNSLGFEYKLFYRCVSTMGVDTFENSHDTITGLYWLYAKDVGEIMLFEFNGIDTLYTHVIIEYSLSEIMEQRKAIPNTMSISSYPNPFNSSCCIDVNRDSEIEILDTKGRVIYRSKDSHFIWKPDRNIRSGIYFVRARNGEVSITKRIVYLK